MHRLTKYSWPIIFGLFGSAGCSDDDEPTDADSTSSDDSQSGADDDDASSDDDANSDDDGPSIVDDCEVIGEGLNPDFFIDGSLDGDISEEDCTLANGVETTCYRIVVAGEPANHEITAVCPRTIEDAAAGLWIVDGEAVEVDGPFIENLATLYEDDGWQMYDPDTGDVIYTETAEDCQTAGGMPISADYANYCVECTLEQLGGPMTREYLIPKEPVLAQTPTEIGMLAPGVSLNGVTIEFPADIAAIEQNKNIAPFDFCGGHVNFNIGYHYHEELGCIDGIEQCDGHAPLIGYAQDGFAIHEMNDENGEESSDLDDCRGHDDDLRGYHYHAASPGENSFIGCLSGELVEAEGGGMGGGMGPPGR